MKITLDQATLAKAVISHLKGVGVQSDILEVNFRYTRVPYTVFAEVELAEGQATKPAKVSVSLDLTEKKADEADSTPLIVAPKSLVDPDNLPPESPVEPDEPRPDSPAAPLFGGS